MPMSNDRDAIWTDQRAAAYEPIGTESSAALNRDRYCRKYARVYARADELLAGGRVKNLSIPDGTSVCISVVGISTNQTYTRNRIPLRIELFKDQKQSVGSYSLVAPESSGRSGASSLSDATLDEIETWLKAAQENNRQNDPGLSQEAREFFRRIFALLTGDTFAPGKKEKLKK